MKKQIFSAETVFYAVFIILSVYKVSFCGFYYLPYLDDYVQYIFYPSVQNPLDTILFGGAGTAFTRPLAAILDVYFWSLFAHNFSYALIFLSILYAVSGIIFLKALSLSPLFLVLYTFLPSLSEGTFWISAATRIIPAMFFTAVSIYAMQKNSFLSRIIFFISNLLSLCFYEQIAILSFVLTFFIFLKNHKKYIQNMMLSVLNIFIIGIYYFSFGKVSDNADRLSLSPEIFKNLKSGFSEVFDLVLFRQIPLYTKGFSRSMILINENKDFLWLLIMLLLCFLFSLFAPESNKKIIRKSGAFLFASPLLPFFLIKNPWLNFRNVVPSVLGFAILFDSVFSFLTKYRRAFIFTLTSFFLICNTAEVYDYTKTMVHDYNIIRSVAKNPLKDKENENIYYYPETTENYLSQTSPYNDHIMSITGSDWGLTGTVRAVTNNKEIVVIRNKD